MTVVVVVVVRGRVIGVGVVIMVMMTVAVVVGGVASLLLLFKFRLLYRESTFQVGLRAINDIDIPPFDFDFVTDRRLHWLGCSRGMA